MVDRPDLGLRDYVGSWIIEALRAGDTQGAAENRADDVEEQNKRVKESYDREMADQAKDFSKEMRKPLIKLFEEGPESDYKGVY